MQKTTIANPMQALPPQPAAGLAQTDTVSPQKMLKRSNSLPISTALFDLPARRGLDQKGPWRKSVSQYGLPEQARRESAATTRQRSTSLSTGPVILFTKLERPSESSGAPEGVSEHRVSRFLEEAKLNMALRGDRLVTRHVDHGAAEAQRSPSRTEIAQVCKALIMAEKTPEKEKIAAALLPAINAQLIEHIATRKLDKNLEDWLKDSAKKYCAVLSGRDLAVDDAIGAINTYLFKQIGTNTALKGANIAGAALTGILMLAPTVGENLPPLVGAIKEGRYRDAAMPALSIMAISAMTLNPTMAAFGKDRASAIAAAVGNALMMAHLPEILHHGYEWMKLKKENFPSESHPATRFAQRHGLVDQGAHTALDFLHEFGAQAGFLAFNGMNALGIKHSDRNPAVFPLLGVLLGSFALDTARGDQPFSEFAADRDSLATDLTTGTHGHGALGQAALHFLGQKIAETYAADHGGLVRPLLSMSSTGSHLVRQLGGNTFDDATEKAFLKGLLSRFAKSDDAKDSVRDAIDKIYGFAKKFDPAENSGDDEQLAEILRFVQTQRNNDKGFFGDQRGIVHADNVYRNVISHAIKCIAFDEKNALSPV